MCTQARGKQAKYCLLTSAKGIGSGFQITRLMNARVIKLQGFYSVYTSGISVCLVLNKGVCTNTLLVGLLFQYSVHTIGYPNCNRSAVFTPHTIIIP